MRNLENGLELYMREIRRIPLLGKDEEFELGQKIGELLEVERVRDRLYQQLQRKPTDSELAAALSIKLPEFQRRLHSAKKAKDKIVQSNLRLVVILAKKYEFRGLPLLDLIQEGNLGLIRATESFDPKKGKFTSYAVWWVHEALKKAIAYKSRTIRLPEDVHDIVVKIKKTTQILTQELGRRPQQTEIAARLEISLEKLRFLAKCAQSPLSLETPIGDAEEGNILGDTIAFEGETPEDLVSKRLFLENIENLFKTLPPRQGEVMRLRYGLDDGNAKTQPEVGKIMSITKQAVTQLESKALKKLSHPDCNRIFED